MINQKNQSKSPNSVKHKEIIQKLKIHSNTRKSFKYWKVINYSKTSKYSKIIQILEYHLISRKSLKNSKIIHELDSHLKNRNSFKKSKIIQIHQNQILEKSSNSRNSTKFSKIIPNLAYNKKLEKKSKFDNFVYFTVFDYIRVIG